MSAMCGDESARPYRTRIIFPLLPVAARCALATGYLLPRLRRSADIKAELPLSKIKLSLNAVFEFSRATKIALIIRR